MDPMSDDAVAWVRGQRPSMEALLRALVEESSYTLDARGVDAAGAVLRAAVPLGCRAVASERFGSHLFFEGARPAGEGGAVLVGHHDTVFPREVFAGYRSEGDVGFGPGVLDMKGGLVVMAFALRALQEVDALGRVPLTMAVVADEEVGSPESGPWLAAAARGAAVALVFEAGRAGDAIITRRKGSLAMTARATGRAAHAGTRAFSGGERDPGDGALHRVGRGAHRRRAGRDRQRRHRPRRNLQEHRPRAVRGRARRALRARRGGRRAGRERTRACKRSVARGHDGGAGGRRRAGAAGAHRRERARWLQRYAACQAAAGMRSGEAPLQGGASDASTTASVGVPSIDGLGPRGSGFHTLDERVELDSLVPKCEALVRFLCGRWPTGRDGFSPLCG